MVDAVFTYGDLEYFFLIFARVTAFVTVAPIVGGQNTGVSNLVKIGFSFLLSVLLFGVVERQPLVYASVFMYGVIIVKEVFCGVVIGMAAQMCIQVTNLAGQIVDMMTGLSMVTMMDPTTGSQVTITATIYNQAVMAMLIVSGMYRFMLSAVADSYRWIPVNGAIFREEALVSAMIAFLRNFFVIGFRVALPVFIVCFILNFVLGILAKVAPQMNMFSVGIQIKVLVGMLILYITCGMLSSASSFILQNMQVLTEQFIKAMRGGA